MADSQSVSKPADATTASLGQILRVWITRRAHFNPAVFAILRIKKKLPRMSAAPFIVPS
jgi:hypothetical protein